MKCSKCDVEIDQTFSHALKNNYCPACGENIMDPNKFAAYNGLIDLLSSNFSGIDTDKIANIIIANFEIKQLFKEGPLTAKETMPEKKNDNQGREELDEVEEADDVVDKEEEPKEISIEEEMRENSKKYKSTLERMREEAYEDAMSDRYSIEDSGDDFLSNSGDPKAMAYKRLVDEKRAETLRRLESGEGKVKRSG